MCKTIDRDKWLRRTCRDCLSAGDECCISGDNRRSNLLLNDCLSNFPVNNLNCFLLDISLNKSFFPGKSFDSRERISRSNTDCITDDANLWSGRYSRSDSCLSVDLSDLNVRNNCFLLNILLDKSLFPCKTIEFLKWSVWFDSDRFREYVE